ncbi:MAG TPA: NAD(P)-dependent oxidoreductase [Rhizomicrobium sp.]|jgi:3-hydroxyisobutyrate dehydrogenase|nr:NAD(P)-dependent oxidoreductase [Rhizomicrobium sp.]
MSDLKIGVIGIGAFGSRAAMRLLWQGYHNLVVYDTHEQTPRIFTGTFGGLSLGSPKAVAQLSDIVIICLPSASEMREVFFGWEGLVRGFKGEGLVMDIGTTDPLETGEIAAELARHKVRLVDAPGFGTPDDAREGRLTLVVGGEDDAVERCQPVLNALATKIIRAGATGSAQAAVAIADYVRAARLLAASEAIRLGRHFGFGPSNLLDVCEALGGTAMGAMLQNEVASRRFKSGTQLGVLHDNVALAERVARVAGLRLPLMTQTEAMLKQAENLLGYSNDQSAVIKWLETLVAEQGEAPQGPETQTGPV